jgi:5-deoxy-glucuronate isomerase
MIAKHNNDFDYGYNNIIDRDGKYSNMLMDFGVYRMKAEQTEVILEEELESAFLLVEGDIIIEWEGNSEAIKRDNPFDEKPHALHVPKNTEVKLTANAESQVILQQTENEADFDSKFYKPGDYREDTFGKGLMNGTATRDVITIFDYDNAPYSNMVLGEVIDYPGKWSSFPPHSHEQPEIYYYRFNKPQGFGACFIGDDVFKIEDHDAAAIKGGETHPQVTAPGYAMYYCWMIRHFDDNPWTDRVDDPDHEWLYDEDAKIWPEK